MYNIKRERVDGHLIEQHKGTCIPVLISAIGQTEKEKGGGIFIK